MKTKQINKENMFHPLHANTTYETPEEREKERQLKKHKETCAKNRKKRKSKNN